MSSKSADIDHLLRLDSGESSLTGKLRIEPAASSEHITLDAVVAYLRGREVHHSCILHDEIKAMLTEVAREPEEPHDRVVARGTPPDDGSHSRLVFVDAIARTQERIRKRQEAFLLAQEENRFDTEEAGAVDFYNESAFVIVREGEHIANFIENTLGNDGMDIFGRPIPAKPGKGISNPCDDTCRLDNEGQIFALQDGVLETGSGRISIRSTLDIPGHVDFSTGNIDFPGDIVIQKGVRDRFNVHADFTLEIHKLVEAAHLHSTMGIKLHQGMAGRETGTISSRGDLESGYLDAVEASVEGDCIVEKEITNCTIRVAGRIMAKNASIRGGLLEIAKGGEVGNLGSEQGVPTDVVLGAHPQLQKKLSKINAILPKIEAELESDSREVNSLESAVGRGNKELQTEVLFLRSNLEKLNAKREQLLKARERILALFSKHTRCELTVHGRLFAKTKIWLPGECATFDRDLKGELTICLDRDGKPIIDWGTKTQPLGEVAKLRADERVPARPSTSSESPTDAQDDPDSLDQAA